MVLGGMQWHNRRIRFLEIRLSGSKVETVWPTAPAKYFALVHNSYVYSDKIS